MEKNFALEIQKKSFVETEKTEITNHHMCKGLAGHTVPVSMPSGQSLDHCTGSYVNIMYLYLRAK